MTNSTVLVSDTEKKQQEDASVIPEVPKMALDAILTILATRIYTIEYRRGKLNGSVNFYLPEGSLGVAINRAKRYCEIMRFRFLECNPMITNLTNDEERMNF
jgi:hypothetical protein